MSELLNTLTDACQYQADIKKSRFLANASPAASPELALAFVHAINAADATHHCWAYRIGQDYRFNDDGEPGGTAGRPILQAIEGQGMDAVVVVVTRWYGGIKLGAGGLMRAYGGTAAECLRLADRIPIVAMARLAVHVDFAALAVLTSRLKDWQAHVEDQTFDADGVQLTLQLPETRATEAMARLVDLSRGRSEARRLD
jgi:uncharacterized YigZ family protein